MLEKTFKVNKPIIGMVHLDDLYSSKGLDYVTEKALGDTYNLHLGGHGVDSLLVENWEEDSNSPFVAEETVKRMLRVTGVVRDEVKAPTGVNVLHNDYRAAFRIARELGLPFIQLDVYSDKARTDFTHTQGVQFEVNVSPEEVHKYREGVETALFVNPHPKGYKPSDADSWEELEPITKSVRRAIDDNADGVVITKTTGCAPDLEKIREVKRYTETYEPDFPVIVGSGMAKENVVKSLKYADGAIVGTTFKIDGLTDNPVDPRRVEEFMKVVYREFR